MMQKETDEDTAGIPVGAAQKAPRVAGRWVAAAVVIAMAIGFMVGRIVMGAGTSSVGASSVPSSSPITVRNSPQMTLVPYEGDVTTAEIIQASGDCSNLGDESDAQNLTDETTLTVWRCAGSSQDTELVFDLPSTNSIVGVRITNGNTIDLERYFLQRRLTNVKWLFADGSWVMQGLAANTRILRSYGSHRFKAALLGCRSLMSRCLGTTKPKMMPWPSHTLSSSPPREVPGVSPKGPLGLLAWWRRGCSRFRRARSA